MEKLKIINLFYELNRLYSRKGDVMDKFDIFLKKLLQAIFREYPYDIEKSKTSLEKIKSLTKKGEQL